MSELNNDMLDKLKSYLLSELHKKELLFDVKFDLPSTNNYQRLFSYEPFIESVISIMMLNESQSSKQNEKSVEEESDKNLVIDIESLENNEEIEYVDNLFNRIDEVFEDTSSHSLEIFLSFHKLRENYFRLNNLQKHKMMKKKPELLLQLIELEDHLVENGVLLPSEVNHLSSVKNVVTFGIKPNKKSPNEYILDDLLEVTNQDKSEINVKNRLLFRNFMESVGVDMEFTEKCFNLTKNQRKTNEKVDILKSQMTNLDIDENTYNQVSKDVRRKFKKMIESERVQKMTGVTKLIEYMEILMGDTIDHRQNYVVPEFEVMFGFERNSRKLLEDNTIARELNEMQENYDIIDSDHTSIAR
jgi:hypothetical protein